MASFSLNSFFTVTVTFQDDSSVLTDSSYDRDSGIFYDQLFSTEQPDENAIFSELLSEGEPGAMIIVLM